MRSSCSIALLATVFATGAAVAGPNAGGTLVLHANTSIAYTPDQSNYCGEAGLTACDAAVSSVTGADPVVFFAVAAFPSGSSPRLAGLTFGVNYDSAVTLVAQGACGDFELSTGDWPSSGAGTAITWNTANTGVLVPAYWFAGYNYYAPQPAHFGVGPHPTQGGNFADDAVPANLDPVSGFGVLGFDAPGSAPCPQIGATGACCFSDGSCAVLGADGCVANGGSYQGNDTNCDPNPCVAATGACCHVDGTCTVVPASECIDHDAVYQGDGTTCDPNPCPPAGACCEGEVCEIFTEDHCGEHGGDYIGDNTVCDPNPCLPVATQKSTWGQIKQTYR